MLAVITAALEGLHHNPVQSDPAEVYNSNFNEGIKVNAKVLFRLSILRMYKST